MLKTLTALAAAAILVACGGGGGDSPPAQTPSTSAAQGLWVGTTTTNRAVTGLVFSDGAYYVLYSRVGNPAVIGGVVQGNSTASAGAFTSTNVKDFNLEGAGVLSATLSGSYTTKQSLSGTVSYAVGATPFTSTYDAAYETVPLLSTLAGTYSGTVAFSQGTQASTVSIASSGAISANNGGCVTTGSAAPRTDGNAYNITLTFGPAPCFFVGQTFTGIAYFSAATKRIYAVAPNPGRTDGVLFVGTKP